MIYTSIDNKKIKELKKLNQKKYRDLTNTYLIEGEHLINEAYKGGYLIEMYKEETNSYTVNVPTNIVSREVLKYISSLETPTVIGLAKKKTEDKIGDRVIILEDIQDPGNLGTIIRSAVAFNIDTIILSKKSVDLYNDKVVRATQGMLFKVNIIVRDTIDIINTLKKDNYYIYGTKVDGGKSLKTIEKRNKFAIIMGNEGAGMSDEAGKLCDAYIYIDINKNCESLNVGVATSIILYELDK